MSGYIDPNTPVLTGSQLRVTQQSWQDTTVPFLYQQLAVMGRRVTMLEAHLALLIAAVQGPGELF